MINAPNSIRTFAPSKFKPNSKVSVTPISKSKGQQPSNLMPTHTMYKIKFRNYLILNSKMLTTPFNQVATN